MDFLSDPSTNLTALILAVVFSGIGCFLAVDFMSRTHRGSSVSRLNWLFIVSIVYGTSSWASQVMLFEAVRVVFSPSALFGALLAMIFFSVAGFSLALSKVGGKFIEVGGAIIGLGNIVALNLIVLAAGGHVRIPDGYDVVSAAYFTCVALSVIAFSVASRTSLRSTHAASALIMVLGIAALVVGGMPHAGLSLSVGAGAEIIVPSVSVIMAAVLGTALAAYNIENQSRLEAINTIKDLSVIDSLTSLSNREGLKTRIAELIDTTDRSTAKVAVLAFNLNRFRLINDVHGSEAGDLILKTVASRLTAALGPSEFIARVSGDEFYAVKAGIHRKADAVAFASKLLEIVHEPIFYKTVRLDVSARIGGALFPNTGDKVDDLMGQADIAMCRAGATSAEGVVIFDPAIDKAKRDLNALSIDLRKAIDDEEFELYYQPQHATDTRQLIGFEALIRWNHPLKGMVSPADFIPLAEKTGMINEIGAWVIRESCIRAAGWASSIKVAVNVSANQIMRHDLPDIVYDAIARSGIDPSRLELEITESGIINDERHAISILNRLKALGCSIAMDDFGTGFSSLSTFKKFPFDKIKIDRAFISDLATNKQSSAIVNAAMSVGRSLGITVLAEGVEDEEQLAILEQIKCDEVQGYFFGRPVPVHEAEALLREARLAPQVIPSYGNGKVVELQAFSASKKA